MAAVTLGYSGFVGARGFWLVGWLVVVVGGGGGGGGGGGVCVCVCVCVFKKQFVSWAEYVGCWLPLF